MIHVTRKEVAYTVPRIPLRPDQATQHALQRAKAAAHEIHNLLVRHAQKSIRQLDNDKEYRQALHTYGISKNKLAKKNLPDNERAEYTKRLENAKKILTAKQEEVGLTQNDFQKYANAHRLRKFKSVLYCNEAQEESDRVWASVAKYLFHDGKKIHYQRWNELHSLGAKSKKNSNAVPVFDDNKNLIGIKWQRRFIPLKRALTEWEKIGLSGQYCRLHIIFEQYENKWAYYVNITMKGHKPTRARKGKEPLGLDPGTSTMAWDCEKETNMVLLAPDAEKYEKKIEELDRRIEQSRRAMNSQYYNEDGTCKEKEKGEKRSWVLSDHCRYLKRKKAVLERKKTLSMRQSHSILANHLVSLASVIYTEPMDYKVLMKRAKLKKRADGRYKRRKRWGKSISNRAPATFLGILGYKCECVGVPLREVDQWSYRGSQLDHDTGELKKVSLGTRWKTIAGERVQRDMYTGFLLRHARRDLLKPNRAACKRDFPAFVERLGKFVRTAVENDIPRNACFGF